MNLASKFIELYSKVGQKCFDENIGGMDDFTF